MSKYFVAPNKREEYIPLCGGERKQQCMFIFVLLEPKNEYFNLETATCVKYNKLLQL